MSKVVIEPIRSVFAAIMECKREGYRPGAIRISKKTAEEIIAFWRDASAAPKKVQDIGFLYGIPCDIVDEDVPPKITWRSEYGKERDEEYDEE